MGSSNRGEGQFEDPSFKEPDPTSEPETPFEDPDAEFDDVAEIEQPTEDAELTTVLDAGGSDISQIKSAIEGLLLLQAGTGVQATSDSFSGLGNIQGVGYSLVESDSDGVPGTPSLVVFTAEPSSEDAIKGAIANAAAASDEELSATPITVVQTGIIDIQPHRMKMRPAPCGISVGHHQITAGTLGALARGRRIPRRNRLFILSNNHVLANTNAGPIGANILQPGAFDGGKNPQDKIAELESFVRINFAAGSTNLVDCATGRTKISLVRKEFLKLDKNNKPTFFRVGNCVTAPRVGMQVGKSGRTTQVTSGRITGVGVTVNVNFGGGRIATFRDQISIVSLIPGKLFSDGGDSGSLIYSLDARRCAVGLLFAGGGGVTFANRIDHVLKALDINLVV